jgi:protein-tyrosine phosphatase
VIDLHCHLLGKESESRDSFAKRLEVCRQASEDGVRLIVATPRWAANVDEPPLSVAACWRQLEHLRQEMPEEMSLKLGFLLEFSPGLPALLEKYGSSITLCGGRTVFVSLRQLQLPAEAESVWSKLSEKGFSVLLARAECNVALRRNPSRLEKWIKHGLRLQLDAASLTGLHGHEIQQFALQCLKKYEGSVILAANTGTIGARSSTLALAREELLKKNRAHKVRQLLMETPAAMLGEDLKTSVDNEKRTARLSTLVRLRAFRSQRALPDES